LEGNDQWEIGGMALNLKAEFNCEVDRLFLVGGLLRW
jgi:hypothetical protein